MIQTFCKMIDDDHEKMFLFLKKIKENIDESSREFSELEKEFNDFYSVCEEHFKNEEKMMKQTLFSEYKRHSSSHSECLSRIKIFMSILNKIENEETKRYILEGISKMLNDLIIPHIMYEDTLLANHINLFNLNFFYRCRTYFLKFISIFISLRKIIF